MTAIKALKRKLMPHNRICCGEYRKSQILFLIDAAFVNAAYVLTSGVFLSGFVIYLKGSDFIVALLNNSVIWASILTVFSFLIFERIRARKKLLISSNIVSRFLSSAIGFLPLIFNDEKLIIVLLAIMVITSNLLWGFYQVGYMIWYMEVVPQCKKNDYLYFRMFIARIAFTISTIIMGYVLDLYKKTYTGFLIAFITSLILSAVDVIILLFVEEPEYKVQENEKNSMATFLKPFLSIEFRNFLIFIFLYYLSLTISTSFTLIYLIRYLDFDYGFISTINVVSYILMIVSTRFWGKIQGRKGTVFVLKISAIIAILEYLIYFFLTEKTFFIMYFSSIISGIGNGGFNIAIMAYRLEIMPENGKSIYEGWFKAIYGISVLLAPFIGKILMNVMPDFSWFAFPINKFQLLYLVSFVFAGFVIFLSFYKPGMVFNRDGYENEDSCKNTSMHSRNNTFRAGNSTFF